MRVEWFLEMLSDQVKTQSSSRAYRNNASCQICGIGVQIALVRILKDILERVRDVWNGSCICESNGQALESCARGQRKGLHDAIPELRETVKEQN